MQYHQRAWKLKQLFRLFWRQLLPFQKVEKNHGHGEEAAGGLHLVALLQLGDVAEHDAADLVLLQIERDADGAAGELHHLVIHHAGEAVDLGDAVGDGADGAGVLLDGLAGELGDLLFDLFEDGAHRK